MKSRAIKWLKPLGIGLACLAVLILVSIVIFQTSAHSRLDQIRARLRAEGVPITPADLQAKPLPASQNAALVYVQLNQLLQTKPLMGQDSILDDPGKTFPPVPPRLVQVRQAIHNRQDIVQRIHRAATMPQCVFAHDYSSVPVLPPPEYDNLRSGARILINESGVLLADGKPLDAVRNQALGFQMARHLAAEHEVTGQLIAVSLNAITLSGMRSILYASGERPGVAEAVANAIVQNWQPVNMAHMIEGDIVSEEVMCAMMHQHRSVGIPQSGVERLVAPLWTATFLDANEYHLLNYQYRIYKSLKRPYLDAKREIDAIVKEVEGKSGNPSYTYASIWVPTYAKLLDKQAQDEALAANVRAGALVLAYRAQHGHFPERLDEVLSPVPVDPFSGQPLRYRFENGSKGFVVYSVGPTGGFDGGTPERGPDHNREALFRYPLPVYLQK